jgi:energy-coupling factor transporter ATP-binding protein EcfA2
MSASKLSFPRVSRVRLRRFSLFAANPDADFTCDLNVLCLVGANGVGKSTLLSAINFCLTGVVPDPTRTFESMDEFYKFTREFSSKYFRGRITPNDEEDAEITVWFNVGPHEYEVQRGLFEPDELRGLVIKTSTSRETESTDSLSRTERHKVYAESLVKHTGIASFQEFAFLQHFVFTFDEQRRTLFWHPRIMERVLYRAFGLAPNMARQADTLRREIQAEDSKVRNRQWEATRMRKRINEIRAQTTAAAGARDKFDELSADHVALSQQFEEDTKSLRVLEDSLKDTTLRLAEQSVRESALRDEYARLFDQRFGARPAMAQHPVFVQSIAEGVCALCGRADARSQAAIVEKAKAGVCPLCDSDIEVESGAEEATNRLREIDRELTAVRKAVGEVHKLFESLKASEKTTRLEWERTKDRLDDFDRQNGAALEGLRTLLTGVANEASLAIYRDQLAAIEKDKKTAFAKREEKKAELADLQKRLEQGYLEAEQSFVPTFAELAHHFLGMPLSVQLDTRGSDDVRLIVTVRGTTRRQQQELSESQRFFLDIALRMALTQHMSDPVAPGGIFIDTPEGSLDIAYEKRAGDMLGMFAAKRHQIIMTANLNTSRLLLALAHKCGRSRMRLCRMTDWAELSEVQQAEEALFDEAYSELEKALDV